MDIYLKLLGRLVSLRTECSYKVTPMKSEGENMMKAIILTAGYATRLYPLTLNKPKALLEVAGRTILDYIYDKIESVKAVSEVYVVTNHKFYNHFVDWKKTRNSSKNIVILDDGTTCEEERLGAIGDIYYAIQSQKIHEDILVIAGDNLFTYSLEDFYEYYLSVNKDCICVHELSEKSELMRMAVACLDKKNKVLELEEKPIHPKSKTAVYAVYIYKKETLPLFEQYLGEGNKPDAPGYFPAWLYRRRDVFAYHFTGECYDIGTPASFHEVQLKFAAI